MYWLGKTIGICAVCMPGLMIVSSAFFCCKREFGKRLWQLCFPPPVSFLEKALAYVFYMFIIGILTTSDILPPTKRWEFLTQVAY